MIHTPESLKAFEELVAEDFNAGLIRAPVHLSCGGEQELIDIFEKVQPQDWVFTYWRSHYHCLLKGVPSLQLRKDIRDGRSITLCYPEYRVFSSAIVGGQLSIAVGTALSIKRRGHEDECVWVFCGDMTWRTGAFTEALEYAQGHDLPIKFIVENNDLSVNTNTLDAWGRFRRDSSRVTMYHYPRIKPHSGTGKWVDFKF